MYTIYNISNYLESLSIDLKFATAIVYDNGKMDGSRMISHTINYFNRKTGGKDIIITSINLFNYLYTDSIFHTESSYHKELLINSNFEYKTIPVNFPDQSYMVEF